MAPLISILIPAYNAWPWIAETIRSALGQTWPNKEVIVVDDGSTDRTLRVAQQFEAKGVRVVTQPNQGAAAARNTAFSLSRGDYIQWLDADDLLSPHKVAHRWSKPHGRRTDEYSFLRHGVLSDMSRAKQNLFQVPFGSTFAPTEWLIRKWEGHLHVQTATWLVSRELTEAAGPWDPRLVVDDDGEYFCSRN